MARLRAVQGADHNSNQWIFVPAQLDTVSHVFVRIDAHHAPLQPRFEGPYAVLERRPKDFKLQLGNRTSWIPVDRLKPAFVLRDDPLIDHSYAMRSVDHLPTSKLNEFVFSSKGGVMWWDTTS